MRNRFLILPATSIKKLSSNGSSFERLSVGHLLSSLHASKCSLPLRTQWQRYLENEASQKRMNTTMRFSESVRVRN